MEQGQILKSNNLTKSLISSEIFKNSPFSLIDVGCSGGISNIWNIYEPYLKAYGIDPVIAECENLNRNKTSENINYYPALIGLEDEHKDYQSVKDATSKMPNPWNDLSVKLALDILDSKIKDQNKLSILNNWHEQKLISDDKKITLNKFVNNERINAIDFIKIDIDSNDFEVLMSLGDLPFKYSICGFALEVNFYGGTNSYEHTFHNTNLLMKKLGYQLFDLSIRKYSLSCLPFPFEYDIPAQTTMGRPYQGDAIYLLDPVNLKNADKNSIDITSDPIKLLKLVCLFENFGLYDHSAKILIDFRDVLENFVSTSELLNILVKQMNPNFSSYEEYMNSFKSDPIAFSRLARNK